jgi:hypothetical protein
MMAKARAGGFRFAERGTMDLRWDEPGHRLHGLVLTVRRRVPVGLILAFAHADVAEMTRMFVAQLVAWNVVDERGEPVPPTLEAFASQVDVEDLRAIVMQWQEALTEPGAPFGEPSRAGGQSAAG